jgi:hypothetical protein
MLNEKELTQIAVKVTEEFKKKLKTAHENNNTKLIAQIMEEIATYIIKEFTDKKAMGELSMNFNSLMKYLVEHFPLFFYYFDTLSQTRSKSSKRIFN